MKAYLREWYRSLIVSSQSLLLSNIYKDDNQYKINLQDVYIEQNAFAGRKYGVQNNLYSALRYSDTSNGLFVDSVEDKLLSSGTSVSIITGDMGMGKTCFLRHLSLEAAKASLNERKSTNKIINKYWDYAVFFISIKEMTEDAVNNIEADNTLELYLKATLKAHVRSQNYMSFLEDYTDLTESKCLLLIDGIDETSEDIQLQLLKDIKAFCYTSDNVAIITTRPYLMENDSFNEIISDFSMAYVAPFNKDQVRNFLTSWSRCIVSPNNLDVEKIINEIYSEEYLIELATTPLFLTLITLIYINNGYLPMCKTTLYEETVDLVLKRWNKEPDADLIRRSLEAAAFNIMVQNENKEYKNIIHSPFIVEALAKMYDKPFNYQKLIRHICENTGIIFPSGQDYVFVYRSIMEYLAACHIVRELDVARFVIEHASNYVWWREVCIFSITKLASIKYGMAEAVLFRLVPDARSNSITISPELLIIACSALLELKSISANNPAPYNTIVIDELFNNSRLRLKKYVGSKKVPYLQRVIIGDLLGKFGDDRKGIRFVSSGDRQIPDISWKCIPGGVSLIGLDIETKNHAREICLPEFFISQYPISNSQFHLFIEDDGYKEAKYWTKEGWNWVCGKDAPYLKNAEEDRYPKDRLERYLLWLDGRKGERRLEPYWINERPWNIENRPVVGVTWYEAIAYCKWLNDTYLDFYKNRVGIDLSKKCSISLPTLEEWEKAARGKRSSIYPWGKNFGKSIKGNSIEAKIGQTCTLGVFPEGRSTYGVDDVAGNVYEWIATGLLNTNVDDYTDFTNDIELSTERLVKGGAWNFEGERMRCSYDEWDYPLIFDQNTGFRPVLRIVGA